MKPFTLEWWIYLQGICYDYALHEMYKCEQLESERWVVKSEWIGRRIINKYGED